MRWIFYCGPLFFWMICSNAWAQTQDSTVVAAFSGSLSNIPIEAARLNSITDQSAPFGVSLLERPVERRNFEPGLSLDEVLSELPGLWVNDRGNASIGERISIRGMGWRAAFGVRGVQVILDGIPLTMPDGQAFADIISPAMIERAELIRGPSSLFWGNGSGGVLFISTRSGSSAPALRIRTISGGDTSFDTFDALQHVSAESQFQKGRNRFNVFVSNDQRSGYREYSSFRFTRAAFYGTIPLQDQSIVQFTGALADQDAENPGQLTMEQVEEDPRLANTRNVDTSAGKESFQAQLGGTWLKDIEIGQLSATLFGIVRDLDNPLSFTYIDLNRLAGGLRIGLQNQSSRLKWGLGLDMSFQDDDRRNLNNDGGNPGTEISLDQNETVRAFSSYGFINYALAGPLTITAGLRSDFIQFTMSDNLLSNGDQSGDRNFSALSPAIGLSYAFERSILYTNYRNAFETPTTTELVNRPNLDGGFNPDVDPQQVNGFEVGLRGNTDFWMINYDFALYTMSINDRLTPFQTEEGGDRTFYRNLGKNEHQGLEVFLSATPLPWLNGQLTHTSNRFEYKEDELAGNRLPGIPDHRTQVLVRASVQRLWIQGGFRHVSSYYVNDANTEKNDAYSVVDLNVGASGITVNDLEIHPFFKISNVLDEQYNNSVVVNAFGGRYYEPAPNRSFQLGLNILL